MHQTAGKRDKEVEDKRITRSKETPLSSKSSGSNRRSKSNIELPKNDSRITLKEAVLVRPNGDGNQQY